MTEYDVKYIVRILIEADNEEEAKRMADLEVENLASEHEFHSVGKAGYL